MVNPGARSSTLKILVAHNAYQQRGGEDAVVDAEIALLRSHGHEVIEYRCDNASIGSQSRSSLLAQTLWSQSTYSSVRELIRSRAPHVVHVHNTFPLISPSVYWAADRERVPLVQSLHNFRLACAQATFLRNGQVCEDCLQTLPWRGVLRRCYRGSIAQSGALVGMLALHRSIGSFRRKVTRYIALSQFSRQKFIAAGIPANKLTVKPNFVHVGEREEEVRRDGLFVGRLSEEKGINVLAQALNGESTSVCAVVGSGPMEQVVASHPRIRWLGWQDQESVRDHMARSAYLVLPSIGYEQFPLVVAEAFACGLPIIGSRLGALSEIIQDGHTGLLFQPGNAGELAEKIAFAAAHPNLMRAV